MRLTEILQAVNAAPRSDAEEVWIDHISTDSREQQPGSLFLALRGERLDGHEFILQALQNGAAWVLADKQGDYGSDKIIYVKDTTDALLQIAARYRDHYTVKVTGVTGSVGKTTTKEMIACVLSARYCTLKTEGNQNNQFGMPKTLLRLTGETQAAVIEMGMCGFDEIRPLSLAAKPEIAVITSVGVSHIEKLGSRENILKAKLEITEGLRPNGILILNGDNDLLSQVREPRFRQLFYGIENKECDVCAVLLQENWQGSLFDILYQGKRYPCNLPVAGRHNVLNALAAFTVGICYGIEPQEAALALQNYQPTGMRQHTVQAGGITVVEDCYNASPDSMRAAISTLEEFPCKGKKLLVFSDMLELGALSCEAHEQVGRLAAQSGVDALYAWGQDASYYVQGAKAAGMQNARFFSEKEQLCQALLHDLSVGDLVWVKASRGMKLEEVLARIYEVWTPDRGADGQKAAAKR